VFGGGLVSPLNTYMNDKVRLSPNMASFVAVKRGNWVFKVSVYKSKQILVVAHHCFDRDTCIVRYFTKEIEAANFIEYITLQE
jgi:hypothetical protein